MVLSYGFIFGMQNVDKSIAFVDASTYWLAIDVIVWGMFVELAEEVCWANIIGACWTEDGILIATLVLDKYNLTLPSGITSVT